MVSISVVMAVYNADRYLEDAINSILNQTYRDLELLIIDDCSTDRSFEIANNLSKTDSRIMLLKNEKNIGAAMTRNNGLNIAHGKYIAICDADDITNPVKFEKQMSLLEDNPDLYLVGTGANNISAEGKIISVFKPVCGNLNVARTLPYKNPFYHSSVMFRNTHEFEYRDFWCVEDYDLFLRMLSAGKVMDNIPDPFLGYRISYNSQCWKKAGKQRLFACKAQQFFQERQKMGQDSYADFDPQSILGYPSEESSSAIELAGQIAATFQMNDFIACRFYIHRYWRFFGIGNKYWLYYLGSFMGGRILGIIRSFR